ncbi:helix-turn-helix domain-containing protein [Paenibacillus allorhizosphaerae]|uniref:HTH-type transcriptional activator Btr n=1 Tax=Paenibacillus allorhizosphaerae TaxID=2849866 RepID=A0ABM8V9U2_9BACL|nr:AraC family transcriptional regulator [Paenibacillus allorhizosphaerae]CAG7614416.1 HTH-type transcriptional activator Btr [Paenibacillus allorhizosphaerae]
MPLELIHSTFDFERIRLIVAGDFIVKPGWIYGPVCYHNHQIVYFPVGTETKYVCSNKTIVLNKPCIIITPPGETYSYEFDKSQPVRHLFITFYWEAGTDNHLTQPPNESVCLHSVEETFVPLLIKQILYLSNKKVYLWEERCKLLLASALAELEGLKGMPSSKFAPISDTKHSLPVLKALDYIDRHLTEPITVDRLAQEAGWSHEHFTRKFVQYTGMTPQKAIIKRRIERACQLLVQEKWNISEIAYAVGFQNVHYFYRTFMNMKGMTASQYRQKYSSPQLKHLSPVNELEESYPLNHYYYYS